MQVNLSSLIDLTSLNEADTEETILTLCQQASNAAAVCVYPRFVKTAAAALKNSSVKIATVVNFPRGDDPLDVVLPLIQHAIAEGATEIDVVFPYSVYLSGRKKEACDFIRSCKNVCGETVLLKVILETGVLQDPNMIFAVSEEVIAAGADFLKTSTGKVEVGATLLAAEQMLLAIKKSGKRIGFKASGGIRTVEQAREYVLLAERIMGAGWVSAETFRIGTSRLLK